MTGQHVFCFCKLGIIYQKVRGGVCSRKMRFRGWVFYSIRGLSVNLSSLNPQQLKAVTTILGPVMILAGAGTGKTRVITYRVAHLIECGVSPWQILAVTFTNKAAREMQERIVKLVPKEKCKDKNGRVQRPTICTFHSLCVRILRQFIDRLGYKKNFVIYSESDQMGVLRKVLSHIHTGDEKVDIHKVQSLISNYKNNGEDAFKNVADSVIVLAEDALRLYDSALRGCNAVDFDDLILLVLKLFREHPDVLEACRSRYRYVMVDEYQDTNSAQFELVHFLAQEHRNLCVVGDDDQSIYGWRGAQVSNLLDMEKFYPEVKVVKLEQNYRSTNIILKAANMVIRNNARRREKNLWSTVEVGEKIGLATYESPEAEAQGVVDSIEHARLFRKVPWEKQAILFRTNQQSRPLETALRKAHIRYNLIGGQSFFDRAEIQDLLGYLKLFYNPADEISLLRVANTPPRGISDLTLERLLKASQEHGCGVIDIMGNEAILKEILLPKGRQSVMNFEQLVREKRAVLEGSDAGFPLRDWMDEFLDTQGFYADIRRTEKTAEGGDRRIENIRSVLGTLDGYAETRKPIEAIGAFLEDATLDADRSEEKGVEGAVALITMHSCKGLEYPHVHIVGLEEGKLPHSRSKMEGTLDEERRLFYVAITRAKEVLYLSHSTEVTQYGQKFKAYPSQFLKELPEDLIIRSDVEMRAQPTQETAQDMFSNIFAQLK